MKKSLALFVCSSTLFLLAALTVFGIINTPVKKSINKRDLTRKIQREIEMNIIDVLHKNGLSKVELSKIEVCLPTVNSMSPNNICSVAFISLKHNNNEFFYNQQYVRYAHRKNKPLKKYLESKILNFAYQDLLSNSIEIRMVFKLDKKDSGKFKLIPVS